MHVGYADEHIRPLIGTVKVGALGRDVRPLLRRAPTLPNSMRSEAGEIGSSNVTTRTASQNTTQPVTGRRVSGSRAEAESPASVWRLAPGYEGDTIQ